MEQWAHPAGALAYQHILTSPNEENSRLSGMSMCCAVFQYFVCEHLMKSFVCEHLMKSAMPPVTCRSASSFDRHDNSGDGEDEETKKILPNARASSLGVEEVDTDGISSSSSARNSAERRLVLSTRAMEVFEYAFVFKTLCFRVKVFYNVAHHPACLSRISFE